jgi:hypothetical protein
MLKYNDLYAAVKAVFPGYKIDPSAGSISVVNALQSVSFAIRSDDTVAIFSSVSGLNVDMGVWETRETIAEAVEFGLSLIIKPEDQPDVDLNSPDERSLDPVADGEGSDEIQPAFVEDAIEMAPAAPLVVG